ncbi:unnamed protein product [Sympodiomycopsis kandeliae]
MKATPSSLRLFTLLAVCLAVLLQVAKTAPVASSNDVAAIAQTDVSDISSLASAQAQAQLSAFADDDDFEEDDDEDDAESSNGQLEERGKKHKKKAKKAKHHKKNKKSKKLAKPSYKAQHSSQKKSNSGKGTYFKPGLGACGWHSNSGDMIAAISQAKWDQGAHCGKTASVCKGPACVKVKIVDMCPSCAPGSLDLSPSAFKGLADMSLGVIGITWHFD